MHFFFSLFYPDLPPVAYHQFLLPVVADQYIVTKIIMHALAATTSKFKTKYTLLSSFAITTKNAELLQHCLKLESATCSVLGAWLKLKATGEHVLHLVVQIMAVDKSFPLLAWIHGYPTVLPTSFIRLLFLHEFPDWLPFYGYRVFVRQDK